MASRKRREAAPDGSFALVLRRCHAGEQLHVKVLSDVGDRIMGLLTHWKAGKRGQSVACLPGCPSTIHNSGTFWKGYLAVEVWAEPRGPWVPQVLEVTESLELDMRGRVRRGQTWLVSRPLDDKGRAAAVNGVLTEELPAHAVSLAFEMRAVLWSVYHSCAIELDTPNPLPDRVFVRPVEAPAPKLLQAEGSNAVASEKDLADFREQLRQRGFGRAVNGAAKPNGG